MKILNKIGSMLLIVCLLSNLGNSFPRFSFAMNNSIYTTYKASIESKYTEAERLEFKTTIDSLTEYKGQKESNEGTLYASNMMEEQILYYLIEYKHENSHLEDREKFINPYVYKKYKILAYDNINIIEKDKTGHGSFEEVTTVEGVEREYRYLGYSKTGTLITNDFYPADFESGTDPLTRNYQSVSDATSSWMSINNNPHYGQLYQLMNTNLKNDDVTDGVYKPVGYTGFDLLRLSSFPAYSANAYIGDAAVKIAQSKMVMMQMPSLGSTGQFKLVHGSNQRYYDTFRTQDMTLSAEVFIYPSESVYFIAPGQEEVTIQYEVRTIIDESKTSLPYSNGLNITRVSIQSEGKKEEVFENKFKVNKTLDRVLSTTFSRTINLSHLDLSDGKDTIVLNASSQYTDMTDYMISFKANPVVVTINGKSDFLADFTIHEATGDDVTDARIMIKDLYFKTPVNISVKDASVTSKGNIISRTWSVLKNDSYRILSTGNETDVVFAVTEANKASVLNANKLSFKLEVKTDRSDETEIAIHEVTFAKSAPPQARPAGPVAIIAAKLDQNSNDDYLAMEGEVFQLHGRESYHPEGLKLKTFKFNTNGGFVSSTGGKKNDYIYYLDSGKYYPELTVTDEKGGRDTDDTVIKVKRAEFIPVISVEGALKENREVTISVKNEHNLRKMPIDESSLDWTITPLDGQGDVIKIVGAADGHLNFRSLFKKKGRYQVSVSGDIAGGSKRYSATTSTVISIAEDMAPIADFEISKRQIRDVRNDNMTEMIIYDKSYSPDGDIIVQRKYWYRYDQDNDDEFTDTDWIMISAANFDRMSAFSDQVGGYQFKIEVKENFGQTTIIEFIVDADYKRANTDNKPDDEKRVEIINIAPTVTLDIVNKRAVTLIVYNDYDEAKLADLKNKFKILKAQLLGKKIDLTVKYLSPELSVGTKTIPKVNFNTYLYFNVYMRGEYEGGTGQTSSRNGSYKIKVFLDSFSTNGEIPTKSNKGRFELISIKHVENGGESHSLEDSRGRDEEDWWDTDRFNIQYKDRGVLKTVYYDLSKEHSNWNYVASQSHSTEIDEVRLQDSGIVEDEPAFGNTTYNKVSQAPVMRDGWLKWYTVGTGGQRSVTLKNYNETTLDVILNEVATDDAFFINMVTKEENRLALSETLLNKLKEKNIHYKTLTKDALFINPLSGRYDKFYVDGENYYITVGNLIYLAKGGKYVVMGTLDELNDIINIKSFSDKYTIFHRSSYSYGRKKYTGGSNYIMIDGLEALKYELERSNEDYVNVYKSSDDDEREGLFNDPAYAKQVIGVNPPLWIEKDGNLVGYKFYLRTDNYSKRYWSKRREEWVYSYTYIISKHVSAHILGSGYEDILHGSTLMDDGFQMRGYVHSNGMIYFKKPSFSRYGVSWSNYMTITEGTSNIDYIYYNPIQKSYYVFTKNKTLIKYDIINKKRTVVVTNYLERMGKSVKIDEDTIMIDGKLYDGYKEVYSNDGSEIGNTYFPYRYTITYMLDLEGNYTATKKYYANRSQSEATTEKTYIYGENVSYLPYRQYSFGNTWLLDNYVGEDGYMYKSNNVNKMQNYYEAVDFEAKRFYWNSKKIKSTEYIAHTDYSRSSSGTIYDSLTALTWYEDGSLQLGNIRDHGGGELSYANLTVGTRGELVGESQLIGISALSKAYETLDELMSGIYEAYENYKSSNSIYVVVGESIETAMTYDDYENDPLHSRSYDFVHVNPNYFENTLGLDPTASTGLLKPLTTLSYVGHYVVKPKVIDNPKQDDRFSEYRLENKDESKINIYSHRLPIPQMTFRFGENELDPEFFTLRCEDNGSYDLDHLSEPAKGIIDWEFSIIGEDDDEWIRVKQNTFTHTRIEAGKEYKIAYRVKDKEGAWSKYLKKTFVIEDLPINLNAKLKAQDESFNIQAIPITEFLSIYDLETEYSRELKLEIALYDGDERKGNLITIPFNEGVTASTDSSNSNLLRWNKKLLQISSTLPDKDYKLRITAIDVVKPSKKETIEFDVAVLTPINPVPEIPQVFTANETVELICRTSKYTDELNVSLFDGTAHESHHAMIYSEMDGKKKVWRLSYKIPEGIDDDSYNAVFTGTVNTIPTKTQSVSRSYEYITLKIISAVMFPEDPMAGDKLIWVIESVGGVDRYELILEDDVINNDERKEMGYEKVDYPYYIEVDETRGHKTDQLEYILWCTTPQSITLKGIRNRNQYNFKVRAWKETSYVDVDFSREVIGDVRQLIKIGH